MTSRVSTVGSYSAVLANLMVAQQRQQQAGDQVATQKKGNDLKDYARQAETLTAMRSVQTRLLAYQEQNGLIADKLTTQDTAMNQVMDASAGIRQSIADALSSGNADTLMQDIQSHMSNAVEGMNTRYNGKYLFSGGQIDTKPVTATKLSDLTAPATNIADFFKNDGFKAKTQLDDSTTATTGVLATDLGTDMMTALKAIQSFQESGAGPFGGTLTQSQISFLQSQLATWDSVRTAQTNQTAANGLVQQRVDGVKDNLVSRANTLKGMMGDITDADMAVAATDLQTAQLSVQAAAQVFQVLQSSSLLNLLR